MSAERRKLLGTSATLAVLGLVAALVVAALTAGPVGAGVTLTKRDVKQVAGALDNKIAGRVAFAANTEIGRPLNTSGTDDPVTQLSAQITVPAPGFLVIEGSMESYNLVDNEVFNCFIELDNTPVSHSVRWVRVDGLDQIGDALVNNEENCDVDAVVPVTTGAHTVELVTANVNFDSTVTDSMVLYALYVPYDGTGARPTSFTIERSAAPRIHGE